MNKNTQSKSKSNQQTLIEYTLSNIKIDTIKKRSLSPYDNMNNVYGTFKFQGTFNCNGITFATNDDKCDFHFMTSGPVNEKLIENLIDSAFLNEG